MTNCKLISHYVIRPGPNGPTESFGSKSKLITKSSLWLLSLFALMITNCFRIHYCPLLVFFFSCGTKESHKFVQKQIKPKSLGYLMTSIHIITIVFNWKYPHPFHNGPNKTLNITVFMIVASCGLVEVYRRFRSACCLHHHSSPWWWRQQVPLKRR
jgi:hypothetical protein